MSDARRILVIIDPTADEQPALARAARLAKAFGASLELFVCDYDQSLASLPHFEPKAVERARRSVLDRHLAMLEELRAPLVKEGLSVDIDARWGQPIHRGIVEKAVETKPMLLVKDTHEHPVLRRTLFSNTDWNLIRSCPVPLLLVKPREIGAAPKVLAAVDPLHERDKPADLDREILAFAGELARTTGSRLHVLHAFDSTLTPPELVPELETRHRDALDKLLADSGVGQDVDVHFEQRPAHAAIAKVAEDAGVDFVVMGAVSRSGLERIFLGSTAERVLDRLPCDLVVVKRSGFAPPKE